MFDFNVFFEIAKTWGFVPAYMTNMKFTFFGMRVFFVLFQTLNEFITCFHEFLNYKFTKKTRNFICFDFLLSRSFQLRSKPIKKADITVYFNKNKNFADHYDDLITM